MDLLNTDNPSKSLMFKIFKCLPYKYHQKFVTYYKKQPNRLDIRHFLVLLHFLVAFQI